MTVRARKCTHVPGTAMHASPSVVPYTKRFMRRSQNSLTSIRSPQTLPPFQKLGIQMAQRSKLAGEFGLTGSLHFSPGRKVPLAEQVGRRNYRSPQGTVLIRALRPGQIAVHPKIESHETYSTPHCASSPTASSRSSLRKGLRNTRQVGNRNASAGSGLAAM